MSRRPFKPFRWTRFGEVRIWEYRERHGGPCVECGLPTQWIWFGQCAEFVLAINVVATRRVAMGYALRVRGIDRCGRVTCSTCRARLSGKTYR